MEENLSRTLLLIWLVIGPLWIIYWAGVCGFVATEKNRNVTGWTIAGALFGLAAFIPLAAVPAKRVRSSRDERPE